MTKHRGRRKHLTLHRRPLIITPAVSNQLQLFAPPPRHLGYAIHFDGPGKSSGRGPIVCITESDALRQELIKSDVGFWWNYIDLETREEH